MASANKNGAPGTNRDAIWRNKALKECNRSSHRIASRRLERAVVLLARAGKQLDGASQAASDRHNRNRLYRLATGLREFTIPLARLASYLQRGGLL